MRALDTLSLEFEPLGLKVSWIKTKFQRIIVLFKRKRFKAHHQMHKEDYHLLKSFYETTTTPKVAPGA